MATTEPSQPTYRCARHPNVETVLRCSRCETPICPSCLVYTPVGARCPDCGKGGPNPIYQITPSVFARAAGVAIAGALIGALVWLILSRVFFGGFFLFILGGPIGYGIGETMSRAAKWRRGPVLMALAGASAAAAYLIGIGAAFFLNGAPIVVALLGALQQLGNPFTLIAIVLSVGIAVSRVR